MTAESSLLVPCTLAVGQAADWQSKLVGLCATAIEQGPQIALDIDGRNATAISLQLAIACHRTLEVAGAEVSLGPNMSALLRTPRGRLLALAGSNAPQMECGNDQNGSDN